jgi:hypothetical protein
MNVFISYSGADAALANRIRETLRISGFHVWDGQQVLPGENWHAQAAEALERSDAMVVLLSPNSLRSPNISHEIGFALGSKQYKGRVVSVLTATPDQFPAEGLPWILTRLPMITLPDAEQNEEGLSKIAAVLKSAA